MKIRLEKNVQAGGSRRLVSGLMVTLTVLLQGCVAVAWLCAVGVGNSVNGSVDFQPFQNSWVALVSNRTNGVPMQSIGVVPFEGDKAMAPRFTTMFQKQSDLLVKSIWEAPSDSNRNQQLPSLEGLAEPERHHHAKDIAKQHAVDCILFGRIEREDSVPQEGSNAKPISNRLYLELVNANGSVMWKDELPYSISTGAQPIAEEWFSESLTTHVIAQTTALGLTELQFRKNIVTSSHQ